MEIVTIPATVRCRPSGQASIAKPASGQRRTIAAKAIIRPAAVIGQAEKRRKTQLLINNSSSNFTGTKARGGGELLKTDPFRAVHVTRPVGSEMGMCGFPGGVATQIVGFPGDL